MALFEIIIELSDEQDANALSIAVEQAGYKDATISGTANDMLFSVLVSHPKSSFETGRLIAEALLLYLPPGSKYRTHRSSVSINEMTLDDMDSLLHEIESATYGEPS